MTTGQAVAYVQLLGNAGAQVGLHQVPFVADKRFQLLAYLAYQGDWVSRERAAFLFWPDTDTHNAKQNLRGLLHRVRALAWLTSLEADAYQLRWLVETDVKAFRRTLSEGKVGTTLSRFSEPLLKGLESDGAPEFSEWLSFERTHLHSVWREALFNYVEELKSTGQDRLALSTLNLLLDQDPLDEEALRIFMHVAARAGQPERALRAFHDFNERLREEIGIEITSFTQQLACSIEKSLPHSAPPYIGLPSQTFSSTTFASAAAPAPGPIPTPTTSFVGRDAELAEVTRLLEKTDCRLLTLKGEGGVGKTRLALQVACILAQRFPDGAYFVPLDALTSAESIPSAIAAVVGVELRPGEDAVAQTVRYLRNLHLLLILDNFEHLLEGAVFASQLLKVCCDIKLLVTSRERLDLEEEHLFSLEGMAYPRHATSTSEALAYDGMRLFNQRAQRVQQSFQLSEEVLPHVVTICRLIDGSPLGIELAAVWVRALTVAEIALEIGTNLDFLSSSSRNITERHRSIRAVFEHSWNLLTQAEQQTLRKLSVFYGSFTKEAASVVTGASVAMLAALVDKSLLRLGAGGRYTWHPLLHHYIKEKALASPQTVLKAQNVQAAYFLSRVEKAYFNNDGALHAKYMEELRDEHDNVQGTLAWAIKTGRVKVGLWLAALLLRYWNHYGFRSEGRAFLTEALQHPNANRLTREYAWALRAAGALTDNLARARALYEESVQLFVDLDNQQELAQTYISLADALSTQGKVNSALLILEKSLKIVQEQRDIRGTAEVLGALGHVNMVAGHYAAAQELLKECLKVSQKLGDSRITAATLTTLGTLSRLQADYGAARGYHQRSLEIYRNLRSKYRTAMTLMNLGRIEREVGEHAPAQSFLEKSLALFQELKDEEGISLALESLGHLALNRQDVAAANSFLKKALEIFWDMGRIESAIYTLEGFARLALTAGDASRAAHIFGAAAAGRETAKLPLPPSMRLDYERNLANARLALGENGFASAWTEGKSMDLERVVVYALQNQ